MKEIQALSSYKPREVAHLISPQSESAVSSGLQRVGPAVSREQSLPWEAMSSVGVGRLPKVSQLQLLPPR